ncbi:MAG: YciI family protein, partial [Alphaproteobacteria bacterium]
IERWQSWFDRIGPAIIDPGNPVDTAKTVSAEGVTDSGGDNPLSGYTIIHTESIDQAIELAKACPIIGDGSIEVAEIYEVSM